MLYNNSRPLIIYLSKRGCLEYTIAVIKELGHRNPVLLINVDNRQYFASKFKGLEIKTVHCPNSFAGFLHFYKFRSHIQKIVSELKSEIGQVFLTAFHPYNHSLIKLCRRVDLPSTITIHDFKTHSGERSWLTERIQKKCIKLCSRVNFLSEYVRNQAIKELGSHEKFSVVPHPLVESYARNEMNHNSRPNILFVGRMVAYKGINILLEAIKESYINKLTIAGENQGVSLPDQPNVTVIDKYLTEEHLAELLNTHEILILPYIEATQSGILCLGIDAQMVMVITRVGGLTEQLDADEAVWVDPNAQSIREGIKKLIEDPSFYNSIKEKIKERRNHLIS